MKPRVFQLSCVCVCVCWWAKVIEISRIQLGLKIPKWFCSSYTVKPYCQKPHKWSARASDQFPHSQSDYTILLSRSICLYYSFFFLIIISLLCIVISKESADLLHEYALVYSVWKCWWFIRQKCTSIQCVKVLRLISKTRLFLCHSHAVKMI